MKSVDPNDHRLFSRIVDYSQQLSARTDPTKGNAASERVISSEFPKLMDGKSLSDFVKSAVEDLKSNSLSSLPMRTAVAKAMLSTNVGSKEEASSLILDSKLEGVRCVTVETCREALAFMESLESEKKERMRMLIMAKFPFAKDC